MSSRLVRELDIAISDSNYYDAHQLVNALFRRFILKRSLDTAVNFADKYAKIFADRHEYDLTISLGEQLLRIYIAENEKVTEDKLEHLAQYFTLVSDSNTITKFSYMNELINWSKKAEYYDEHQKSSGSFYLHSLMGQAYLNQNLFGKAQSHLIFCDDVNSLLDLLSKWSKFGYKTENDLFTLRLILLLITLRKGNIASEILEKINSDWKNKNISVELQLAYLSTLVIKIQSREYFDTLNTKYALVIRLDPDFQVLFSEIGRIYFGIKNNNKNLGNFFQSLFSINSPAQ